MVREQTSLEYQERENGTRHIERCDLGIGQIIFQLRFVEYKYRFKRDFEASIGSFTSLVSECRMYVIPIRLEPILLKNQPKCILKIELYLQLYLIAKVCSNILYLSVIDLSEDFYKYFQSCANYFPLLKSNIQQSNKAFFATDPQK